jgi:hypothetical protein
MVASPATTNPNIYVKQFLAYAASKKIDTTTDAIQQWDAEHNDGRMRAAILAKHGEQALIEIAIKALFRQYLYDGTLLRVSPSSANPNGLKQGVKTFSGIQGGRYLPHMTLSEKDGLVATQTERFKEAGRRLKLYGLPLKKLHDIIEEI